MIDLDSIKEIRATLARNKTRTFLTAFGIFWGTLMLALLWGSGQGAQRLLYSNFEGFSSNSALIYTQSTSLPYKGFKKGMWWNFTDDDLIGVRRRVPGIEYVVPNSSRSATFRNAGKGMANEYSGTLIGTDAYYPKIFNPVIEEGRFLNDTDEAVGAKVCVVGKRVASNLFGDESPLGKVIEINHMYYRVVGVASPSSPIQINGSIEESVFMPLSTMRRVYNLGNKIEFLMIVCEPGYRPADLRDQIYQVFRSHHPLHPDDKDNIGFFDISEEFEKVDNIFLGFNILLFFVGFSSLLAGIIGVGNIMWIVVKERTKEFGIRRAIGAKPKSIMSQILAESCLLTVIAGLFAIVVSTGILSFVTKILRQNLVQLFSVDVINFNLSFSAAMIILALFIVLGSAAGTIPALKAMKIKPIEALNDK